MHNLLYVSCCHAGVAAKGISTDRRLRFGQLRRQQALERLRTCDSAAGALSSSDQPEPVPSPSPSQEGVQMFPRVKERDPYK